MEKLKKWVQLFMRGFYGKKYPEIDKLKTMKPHVAHGQCHTLYNQTDDVMKQNAIYNYHEEVVPQLKTHKSPLRQ